MKVLTAAEMREVDRLTSERYDIPSLQLMETAGRSVAGACYHTVDRASADPTKIAVLCGKGNNGGDGFVAARHLQSSGAKVTLYLFSEPRDLQGDAATNLQRWTAIGNHVVSITGEADWQTDWAVKFAKHEKPICPNVRIKLNEKLGMLLFEIPDKAVEQTPHQNTPPLL